jgi:tRNA 5-methylaminomethyl-2-thiouridine biosynthesis bifunctional protein
MQYPFQTTYPLHWNDQGQPISNHFDDIYFSTENGLAETDYVFLQHNNLSTRFAALQENAVFTIAETGFGTGLNLLACCALWEKTAPNTAQLHFITTEKYPLTKDAIAQAAALWPALQTHTSHLLNVYPHTIPNNQTANSTNQADFYRLPITPSICLTLLVGDATIGLQQLLARTLPKTETSDQIYYDIDSRQWRGVDAWFLDGFAPSKNPDMWTNELFSTIKKLSHIETTVATFTAAGVVKRGLSGEGFTLKKVPGYGKKREMLTATYSNESALTNTPEQDSSTEVAGPVMNEAVNKTTKKNHIKTTQRLSTWALINNYQTVPSNQRIAIIGGGLAGCHTAHALAKRGYEVTLFEQANTLASGASGNAQGIVYGKLSASGDPLGELNRYSLRYAQSFYSAYWEQAAETETEDNIGKACGVLQLSLTEKTQKAHQVIASEVVNDPNNLRHVSATEASRIANTRIGHSALYFPKLGWVNPPKLCEWLIQHPNIDIVSNTQITALAFTELKSKALQHNNTRWRLHACSTIDDSVSTHEFDAVVIANAYDAARFTQTKDLPVKQIRGQVSHYPSTPLSDQLHTVVCGKAYIAPSSQGMHCLGASFNLHDNSPTLHPRDHQQNIDNITSQVPDLIEQDVSARSDDVINSKVAALDGRVSFRCVTPDYLPIVGAVPINEELRTRYSALSKNGRQTINLAGNYYPRLYINIGHGSRGLAYTPLCSDILASLIQGNPPPIPQYLIQKLNPSRFTIRDMIRMP